MIEVSHWLSTWWRKWWAKRAPCFYQISAGLSQTPARHSFCHFSPSKHLCRERTWSDCGCHGMGKWLCVSLPQNILRHARNLSVRRDVHCTVWHSKSQRSVGAVNGPLTEVSLAISAQIPVILGCPSALIAWFWRTGKLQIKQPKGRRLANESLASSSYPLSQWHPWWWQQCWWWWRCLWIVMGDGWWWMVMSIGDGWWWWWWGRWWWWWIIDDDDDESLMMLLMMMMMVMMDDGWWWMVKGDGGDDDDDDNNKQQQQQQQQRCWHWTQVQVKWWSWEFYLVSLILRPWSVHHLYVNTLQAWHTLSLWHWLLWHTLSHRI